LLIGIISSWLCLRFFSCGTVLGSFARVTVEYEFIRIGTVVIGFHAGVDLCGVVATLAYGLGAGFETGSYREDLGLDVFERIYPIPTVRVPDVVDYAFTVIIISRDEYTPRHDCDVKPASSDRAAELMDYDLVLKSASFSVDFD
jgi:hypothetical protein